MVGARCGARASPSRRALSARPRARVFGGFAGIGPSAFSRAIARHVELQDRGVMDQAVDRGRSGQAPQRPGQGQRRRGPARRGRPAGDRDRPAPPGCRIQRLCSLP